MRDLPAQAHELQLATTLCDLLECRNQFADSRAVNVGEFAKVYQDHLLAPARQLTQRFTLTVWKRRGEAGRGFVRNLAGFPGERRFNQQELAL